MKTTIILLVCLVALSLFAVGCQSTENTDEPQGIAVGEPNPATPDFSEYDVVCTAEQKTNQICTREFNPVCGDDGVTHSTGCTACSAQVNAYNAGACGDDGEPSQLLDHICSADERVAEICTMELDPVCGSNGKEYGNACGACAADIEGWTRGECTR